MQLQRLNFRTTSRWRRRWLRTQPKIFFTSSITKLSGFGGPGVSVLASGTRVRVFKPCRSRRIFRAKKNPQHALFQRWSKSVGPMSYFAARKRSQNGVEGVNSAKFTRQYSRPQFHPSLLASLASWRRGGTWRRRMECLKAGESNGSLPLRLCPGSSTPEPYQSPDWALVSAQPA